jgi:hypothetical protein
MRSALKILLLGVAILAAYLPSASAQQPRVELELIMERGFPPQNAHEWLRAMERVGADGLRIRAARNGDGIGIKNVGTDRSPQYKVYGMLTSDNRMMLQGATFRMSDVAGIKGYLETLREEGMDGLLGEKMAFGLTARQLVAVHEDLAKPIRIGTQSKNVEEVIRQLERQLATPLQIDRGARGGLAEGDAIKEELRGMTIGTGLAAMLRPLGLVLVPLKDGADVQLVVMDSRDADEHWPIGWPLEDAPLQAAPQLFEDLPVEIRVSLQEALDAIQPLVKIPFIYDQNSMARHGIELANVEVEANGRMSYFRLIKRLLSQTRPSMKAEIRTDEAGKPFLWLTTTR